MNNLIHDEERFRQKLDFSSLKFGKIYPNSTDMEIEFKNKLFFMGQYKFNKQPLENGVSLLFERKVDAIQKAIGGRRPRAFALHISHWTPKHQDIKAGEAYVHSVYCLGKWRFGELAPPEIPINEAFKANKLPHELRHVNKFIAYWKKMYKL